LICAPGRAPLICAPGAESTGAASSNPGFRVAAEADAGSSAAASAARRSAGARART
jgi:hypothetical protein